MNKMPDRIWATPFDSDMDGGTYCDAAERPTSPNHDAWCYVRADLVRALTAERDEAILGNHSLNEHEPTWAELTSYWKARAEAAEAERDRLETALVYAKDYLDLGMEKMAFNVIRHALKGETP